MAVAKRMPQPGEMAMGRGNCACGLSASINPVETSKQFQTHLLGGIRWALGMAAGSSEPNPDVN